MKKMIDISPKALKAFKRMVYRLNDDGKDVLRKSLRQSERKVVKTLDTHPPDKDHYNYMKLTVQTLLYEYELTVAAWICDCCGRGCVELITVEEHATTCTN